MRAGAARTRIPWMQAVDLQADEERRPIFRLQLMPRRAVAWGPRNT